MIRLNATVVYVALPSAQADLGFSDANRRHRARVRHRILVGRRPVLGRRCHLRRLIRGGTRLHHEAGQPEPLDGVVGVVI
jgi:hypothetical protein